MGEQARSAPCVAWVNAKKSIHAPSIQPFLFAAGNLRNMTNPFSEYSQFDALTVSDLIFFVSLFESRSLSNTAAEGGLSLSTASRTLRKLRETFGDPLFLCPCSKEISRYGAHNQRSRLTASVELSAPMSLEEQIAYSEEAASCQLWARLKRSDEKYVTEYAYDHPKFVEDIVRDMAAALNKEERVVAYRVEAENFESIHNHSAYAYITHDKR